MDWFGNSGALFSRHPHPSPLPAKSLEGDLGALVPPTLNSCLTTLGILRFKSRVRPEPEPRLNLPVRRDGERTMRPRCSVTERCPPDA